jgi:predicted transporter
MAGKDKSPHILNSSSTLLGICFVVLTSLNVMKVTAKTILDELTTAAIVMFMASSLLSFLSMRSEESPGERYEKIADFVFLAGLLFLFATTMLLAFNVIQ